MAQIAVPVLYKTVIYNKMTCPIGGGQFSLLMLQYAPAKGRNQKMI